MSIIKNKYFHFLLLAVVAIAVYSNSFHSPFQYDDKHIILWNNTVKSINNLPDILLSNNRPVLRATFALNYHWFKMDTFGYHIFNVLIHIINGVLIYILMSLTLKDRAVSFLAGLFFIVHPLNTQAVNYISARSTSLCAVFYILSVILFAKANTTKEKRKARIFYAGTFLSFLFALGTKEIAVSIPVMFFAYYCVFLKGKTRGFIKKYSLFILVVAGYLLYRLVGTGTFGDYSTDRGFITTVLTNFNAMVYENMKLLFFPVHLNVAYEFPEVSYINFPVIFSMAVVAVLLVIAFKSMKNLKYLSFSILWFFIVLLPTQTLIPREEIICEHRLYLACVSVCMLLAASTKRLMELKFSVFSKKTATRIVTLFAVILAVFFTARTYRRNIDWQSEISIWKKMAQRFPGSYKAHSNLGNSYAEKGLYGEASAHYETLLGINPDDAKVNNNLANVYYLTGSYDKAIEKYKKAINIKPGYITAYNNLAMTLKRKGLFDEAMKVYQAVLKISPGNASTHFRKGNLFQDRGLYDRAINSYKKAIEINPGYAQAYNNLGNAYFYKDLYRDAIESYEKALVFDPGIRQARDNINLAMKKIRK